MIAAEAVRHRLGTAVRFVDAFTSRPIDLPLDVRIETLPVVAGMPAVPWRAVRGLTDQTYRFLVSNDTVMPAGTLPVTVTAPGREYVDFEGLAIALPRPIVAHPPTPARSDFLVQHTLWPTRSLRLPSGETAVVARLVSGGATPIAGLKVTIWPDGDPQPPSPYTYSNERGEVLVRLPGLKSVAGGVPVTNASLQIDITLPPAYVTAVVPAQIINGTGAVLGVPFSIRLGQVTNLTITLP
jgi:hypothetical protein